MVVFFKKDHLAQLTSSKLTVHTPLKVPPSRGDLVISFFYDSYILVLLFSCMAAFSHARKHARVWLAYAVFMFALLTNSPPEENNSLGGSYFTQRRLWVLRGSRLVLRGVRLLCRSSFRRRRGRSRDRRWSACWLIS